MGKKIFGIIILAFFLTLSPRGAQAQRVAGSSAAGVFTEKISTERFDFNQLKLKRMAIRKVLESYNSPLADQTDSFIQACVEHDLECYLLPSIAGVESTFGKFVIPGNNNAFGWGKGEIKFESHHASIMTIGHALRSNYIDRGYETVEEIGSVYCEGTTWAGKVRHFMSTFEQAEKELLYLMGNEVEL